MKRTDYQGLYHGICAQICYLAGRSPDKSRGECAVSKAHEILRGWREAKKKREKGVAR